LAEEFEGEVTFVGVSNNDTVEDGKGYVETYDVPYPMAHAPDVWDLYDVPYQPVTIVLDAGGEEVQRFDGPIEKEQLKEAIQRAL
jgi:hypothetical protein